MNKVSNTTFISDLLSRKDVSVEDRERILKLAAREILNQERELKPKESKTNSQLLQPSPKKTADFFSLFNDPQGLKFLTHDFDPDSDVTYSKLLEQTLLLFKKQLPVLPKSLYALMLAVLTGKDSNGQPKQWIDSKGNKHFENYSTKAWMDWSKKNSGQHPLNNPDIYKIIMLFRSTIRLVKPVLLDIMDDICAKQSLNVEYVNLDKADFYTNVCSLRKGLTRIFKDIESHSMTYKNVVVEYCNGYDNEYSKKIIRITHLDSHASDLEDVRKKFETQNGGSFYELQKVFDGYCNWSVESKWNGKPLRWNILDDTNANKVETLESNDIKGFTHILTFYQK